VYELFSWVAPLLAALLLGEKP